jgi:hypothetical protein
MGTTLPLAINMQTISQILELEEEEEAINVEY